MRISIKGENEAAGELRGMLQSAGYTVTDIAPTHTIFLEEDEVLGLADHFVIDGIECPLERRVMEHIHHQTGKNIMLARVGGVQSDRDIRIRFAPHDTHEIAIGAFRGILEALGLQINPGMKFRFRALGILRGIFR